MYGWGRGWYRGRRLQQPVGPPPGYINIGPCRCGFGPHAVRAPHPAAEVDELNWLKAEKAQLENRIKELEERFKKED